ncbi:putative uncharacterized protein [Pseudomonas sp. StFLB209]|nr:putative uncharacterized protein [Pseudomonas sp. StFLB209]
MHNCAVEPVARTDGRVFDDDQVSILVALFPARGASATAIVKSTIQRVVTYYVGLT